MDQAGHPFALGAEEVVARFQSDGALGLTSEEVSRRLQRFGPNALPTVKPRTFIATFAGQFKSQPR